MVLWLQVGGTQGGSIARQASANRNLFTTGEDHPAAKKQVQGKAQSLFINPNQARAWGVDIGVATTTRKRFLYSQKQYPRGINVKKAGKSNFKFQPFIFYLPIPPQGKRRNAEVLKGAQLPFFKFQPPIFYLIDNRGVNNSTRV